MFCWLEVFHGEICNEQHFIHSGGKRFSVGGDGDTLKIHTRRRRRLSLSNLLTHLLPAHTPTSTVYHPPSNKVRLLPSHTPTSSVYHPPSNKVKLDPPYLNISERERSSWVEDYSGALVTQWLVHRRRGGVKALSPSSSTLQHSSSTTNLSNIPPSCGGNSECGGGALRNRLKTRSKSIMSLATEHTQRPTLTLKRILSVIL
ncbi:hypothetical protein Hamer_G003054 [Homarus americanus]|uniref:Uncharacterized protein n=1 Tax=Homarus americanus TaxID=6706 RepID=A0A8J5N6N2_HOMAM|nr:hypothetical protein Hamer_G003054 [Homarus americanus]